MRVLIICNDFPPLNSIGSRRPYSWYRWFKEFGVEPIVITKQWTKKIEKQENIFKNPIEKEFQKEETEFGTIFRVPIKIIPPEKILLKNGESNLIILRKALTFIYKLFSFFSFFFDKHNGIYNQAKKYLKNEKVDVIIVSGEPFVLFRYGYLLSKKFGIPWVADFRDGWKLNHVAALKKDSLNRFLQLWEFYFEKKFIKNCSFITAPDPYLGEALGKLHNKKWKVVYNGFEEIQIHNLPNNSPCLILTYSGTLNPGQRLEFLLQAILELHLENKIRPSDLNLNFIGIEYFKEQYLRLINFNDIISKYIYTTDRVSRNDALIINAKSDFLIAFTEKYYQVIPAKVFEYFACKKPILILPSDNGLLYNLINETKSGICFNTINELKYFLIEQIQKKKEKKEIYKIEQDDIKIAAYSRRKQSESMINFIKEIIRD